MDYKGIWGDSLIRQGFGQSAAVDVSRCVSIAAAGCRYMQRMQMCMKGLLFQEGRRLKRLEELLGDERGGIGERQM